jgi:hypothetical protein
VADDRHEIAVAARLCSQYAEPVLRIMEGDPFDKARQHFLALRCRLWLHEAGPAPKTPRLLALGMAAMSPHPPGIRTSLGCFWRGALVHVRTAPFTVSVPLLHGHKL